MPRVMQKKSDNSKLSVTKKVEISKSSKETTDTGNTEQSSGDTQPKKLSNSDFRSMLLLSKK